MSKHTPGPWEVTHQNGDPEEGFCGVRRPTQINSRGKAYNIYVAQYCLPEDARLIAAAPDLLEALKAFQSYGCPICGGDCGSANPPVSSCPMRIAYEAISKAEGQP